MLFAEAPRCVGGPRGRIAHVDRESDVRRAHLGKGVGHCGGERGRHTFPPRLRPDVEVGENAMRAPLAPRQRETFDRLVLLCDERQAGVEDLVHLAQLLLERGAVVVGVGALGEERAVQLVQRLAVGLPWRRGSLQLLRADDEVDRLLVETEAASSTRAPARSASRW